MNVLKLQRKFPDIPQDEIFGLVDEFQRLDVDDQGSVDKQTVITSLSKSGRGTYDEVRETLKHVDIDSTGKVGLEDYCELVEKLGQKEHKPRVVPAKPGSKPPKPSGLQVPEGNRQRSNSGGARIIMQGGSTGSTHTINEDERTEFTRHINSVLAGDPDIGNRLPVPTDTNQIFDECRDSLILAKLVNDSVPNTIDTRVLNFPRKKALNQFTMAENANVVINSAKGIGCVVVNVHADDIINGKEHLILGLIWQVIRKGLLSKVDIKLHPELYRLLEEDETLEQFLRLPPEQILLRWFNYHLKAANWNRRVNNFGSDVKDGENYTVLLNQLNSQLCSRAPLQTRDLLQRAEQVLENADKLGARKYLTPASLVAGNTKLNLSFVAHLFNTYPGLDPITEEEKVEIDDFDAEGEREARVFTLWLNSLDVDPPVVSLFEDLKDGITLLQAYDKVSPGTVNWRYVNKRPADGSDMMQFKAIENCNYAVNLGKDNGFSLVGIEGSDITDGQKTLTLALVWQLMRRNIDLTLASLAKNGKSLTDAEILKWAHDTIRKGGKSSQVRSFKDPSLASGVWLLDILHGIKPEYVDYDLVGNDDYENAKLAISIARKLGALIWLVPEDINEVRSRLILTFVASLMAL